MKKYYYIFLLSTIFFAGCTKDKTDLIIGEWKLTSSEYRHTNNVYNTTEYDVFNGTLLTETYNNNSQTYSYSETLTMNADGTYKMVQVKNGAQTTYSGNWFWMNSNKDRTSIGFDNQYEIYQINQLDKNTLVIEDNEIYNDYNDNYSSNTYIQRTYSK